MATAGSTVVEAVTGDDHDVLVGVMSRAFFDDPCFSWVFRDEARRVDDLGLLFRTAWAALVPHGLSVRTRDRAAVALWAPPGSHEGPESVVAPFGEEMGRVYDPGALARLLEFFSVTSANHPTEPHYYLGVLAADPGRQGEGLGSACLGFALSDVVDPAAMPAYLESSNERNVSLYERHSFQIVGVERLGGSTGPPVFFMWRPAVSI